MRVWTDFTLEQDDAGRAVLALSGPLTVASIGVVDRALRELDSVVARIDLSRVTQIDTVGAWTVWRLLREHDAELTGASDQAERLIAAVSKSSGDGHTAGPRLPPVTRTFQGVGHQVSSWGQGTLDITSFLGAVLVAWWGILRSPARMRWLAVVRQAELVGISALGIIGLMSFLVGIVIAQQGA
ncbi:MAG: ABC transporter permease, partial [Novosphingobium sp.]